MNFTKSLLLAFSLVASINGFSRRADAQSPSPAMEFFEAANIRKSYVTILDNAIKDNLPKNLTPAEAQKRMQDARSVSVITSAIPNILRIYEKIYTKEELKALAIFYRSPLGQKMLRSQQQIFEETNQALTPLIRAAIQKAKTGR